MKRIAKVFVLGILFGVLLLGFKIAFKIPEESFWRFYLFTGIAAIVGACLINIIYFTVSMKKMLKLSSILEIEQNPRKFIAENKKLQSSNKNRYIRALINLNLVAAYCDLGEFDTANQILESCNVKEIKGLNIVVYNINKTYLAFRLGNNEHALQLLEQNQKIFYDLRNHKTLGGNIAILNIYKDIALGNYEDALASLSIAQSRWHSSRLEQEFVQLQNMLSAD